MCIPSLSTSHSPEHSEPRRIPPVLIYHYIRELILSSTKLGTVKTTGTKISEFLQGMLVFSFFAKKIPKYPPIPITCNEIKRSQSRTEANIGNRLVILHQIFKIMMKEPSSKHVIRLTSMAYVPELKGQKKRAEDGDYHLKSSVDVQHMSFGKD